MKNLIWISLFGLFVTVSSCNLDSVVPADDNAVANFLFLSTAEDNPTGTKPDKKCNLTVIEAKDLPKAVTDYISANYAGGTIESAGKTDDGKYIVRVKKADGTYVGVAFDANGVFLKEKAHKDHGTPVATADLPKAVTDYVSANYAGGTIVKAFKNTEGALRVIVKKADETFVGVGFDATGKFTGEVTVNKKGKDKGKGRGK
jgi:hypothetical protein